MHTSRNWWFVGCDAGEYTVRSMSAVCGAPLASATHLSVTQTTPDDSPVAFLLRGVVSNERYTTRAEKTDLVALQHALGRTDCTLGALIPIKKNDAWWALGQDERRAIFEDRSQHIALGMRALPAVSRRLHHCRDLGTSEPFDFLTWFDFRREDEPAFDDLLGALRSSEEWSYVEREVDVRVAR